MKGAKLANLGERKAHDACASALAKRPLPLGRVRGGDGLVFGRQGKAAARALFYTKRVAFQWLFALMFALADGIPSAFAEEWNCADRSGTFERSTDCTMGEEVAVSGDLTVTGNENTYTTLTAARWMGVPIYVKPTNCDSEVNPCSVFPFTGECVLNADPNQGVMCDPPACPTGSYNQFISTPLPPPLDTESKDLCGETMPEFSCSTLPTRGVYQRSQNCTLEGEVHVLGDLSVTGQETVYSTLTAKSGMRHFKITMDGEQHGHQIMTFKSDDGIPSITVVNTNFTDIAGSYPFYGYDRIANTNGEDKYIKPTACTSNPCSALPFTGECFNHSAGVLCGIADDYIPTCSLGRVKANVSTDLLPPQLCVCPENMYFNGTTCLWAAKIISMKPESPVPNSAQPVSFVCSNCEGTTIGLTMGHDQWTNITKISSTTITAIPPQGITGQLYPLYLIVDGIQATEAFKFSYMAPNITTVISPPFAGGIVTILGEHFGSKLNEITTSVSGEGACPVPCSQTQWIKGGVACLYDVPGSKGSAMNVYLTVGPEGHEQPSNLATYRYEFDALPPSRPIVTVGINLFVMALKWSDQSNVGSYEVQWSENLEFGDKANMTRTNAPEIELEVPNSLATNVVYVRVKKVKLGEASDWSVVSTAWTTTSTCDIANQYLDAASSDPLQWKCAECPEGASCIGDTTWKEVKALF
eukprot:g3421.t1